VTLLKCLGVNCPLNRPTGLIQRSLLRGIEVEKSVNCHVVHQHALNNPAGTRLHIDQSAFWFSQSKVLVLNLISMIEISDGWISPVVGVVPGRMVTGALWPSPFLASRRIGLRSLIVKQTVHLNTCRFLGHRTIESQVMHFPVFKSLSGDLLCLPLESCCCERTGELPESSSVDSSPPDSL
jgi:hypothetical protein